MAKVRSDGRPRIAVTSHTLRVGVLVALVLMCFGVPLFFSTLFHDYGTPKLVLTQILTICLAVSWIVAMALDGEIYVINSSLYYTLLAFLAIHLISLFQAYNLFQGLETLFQYLCYFLIAIVVFHTVRERRHLLILIGTMALTGTIVAALGLLQYNGVHGLYARWNQPIATIGNVNFVAEYYDVVFPLSVAAIFLFRDVKLRIGALLASFLMACHLVVLSSRGGWLGVIISFSVLGGLPLLRHFRIVRRVMDVTFASIVVVGLGWPVLNGLMAGIHVGADRSLAGLLGEYWQRSVRRTQDALELEDNSSKQRVYLWEDTLRLIFDRPLVGVGVGNFEYNIPQYMSRRSLDLKMSMEELYGRELMAFRAHNEYLEVWAETGILGFGVFCFLLYQIGKAAYGLLKRYVRGEEDLLAVGLVAAIAASLAHSFFSTNLQDPASAVQFWIVVGMVWSLKINAEGEERLGLLVTNAKRFAFGVTCAGVLVLIPTAVFGVRMLIGSHHYHAGTYWLGQKSYSAAEAELKKAVRYRLPNTFSAYQALGVALYRQERWNGAIEAFRRSIYHHRSNATVYYYLGQCLGELGRHDEAVKQLRMAVQLNPLSADLRLALGEQLGILGRHQKAVEHLEEAIRIDPGLSRAHYKLGVSFRDLGNPDAAEEAYRKALAYDPNDAEVLNSLGVLTAQREDFQAAHEVFARLTAENPDVPDYRVNLAVALLGLGRHREALDACLQALQIDPDFARAYAVAGTVFEAAGDLPKARDAYRGALEKDPRDAAVRERLKALNSAE